MTAFNKSCIENLPNSSDLLLFIFTKGAGFGGVACEWAARSEPDTDGVSPFDRKADSDELVEFKG